MTCSINRDQHPCFNIEAKGECARVHLPVAPKCNIKCNYCNRKYDCVNESRPGVSSAVLEPQQAVDYLSEVVKRVPETTVAGIAGPGDAFAEPERTLETLRYVRRRFPSMILCLATNGLNAADYVEELARLQVSHITITVNAVDPKIGARIYSWIRDGKFVYRKERAAKLLLERQFLTIKALKKYGVLIKSNTIVIPGINDHHVVQVAEKMAEMGVDLHNCMPMYPNQETPFEDIAEPTAESMGSIRAESTKFIPQMTHCTRCRADAVGLLDDDRSSEYRECMEACSQSAESVPADKPYVAVATLEGALVNQHLGEAYRFQIWEQTPDGFSMVEERMAPEPGGGDSRWIALSQLLNDCRAVLVSGIGERPRRFLLDSEIVPVEMNGFILHGLDAVYNQGNTDALKTRRKGVAETACCSGQGGLCG
jgi:nitrogen fixation protein NifB